MLLISLSLFVVGRTVMGLASPLENPMELETALSFGTFGLVAAASLLRNGRAGTLAKIAGFSIALLFSGGGLAAMGACGPREGAPVGFLAAVFATCAVMLLLFSLETRYGRPSDFDHMRRHER